MNISKRFAMQMVKELSTILNQHINFIDRDGLIIASTDSTRIGTFHMGAKKMVDENLPSLIVESNEQYLGSRKGVNLPVIVDQMIVGVIGITGERSDVEQYGEIIRKFTEMYIRDELSMKRQESEDRIRSRFLETWLVHEDYCHDSQFLDTAVTVGVNVHIPHCLVAAAFVVHEGTQLRNEQERLEEATRYLKSALLEGDDNHSLRIGSKLIFVTRVRPNLKEKCEQLVSVIKDIYKLDLRIGINDDLNHYKHMHRAYIMVQKALDASLNSTSRSVKNYNDLLIELFIDEIPVALREEFLKKIFVDCDNEDLHRMIDILSSLYANNGSIENTAKQLFIHKNTLQYQLNKLYKKTGYDPRHAEAIPLYSIAIAFYRHR